MLRREELDLAWPGLRVPLDDQGGIAWVSDQLGHRRIQTLPAAVRQLFCTVGALDKELVGAEPDLQRRVGVAAYELPVLADGNCIEVEEAALVEKAAEQPVVLERLGEV